MTYNDLVRLYFDRSNALQWYWTLYVVVIGGLLAFSSLRQRKDALTALLVTVLYCFFAYKNLGAIHDVSFERYAILSAIKESSTANAAGNSLEIKRMRDLLEPTFQPPPYPDVRNFHITSDFLTIAAFWAMEWRRRRMAQPGLATKSV